MIDLSERIKRLQQQKKERDLSVEEFMELCDSMMEFVKACQEAQFATKH